MKEHKIAYIYSNDTHYGLHKYTATTKAKAVNGPAKYIHTSRGYKSRAEASQTAEHAIPIKGTDLKLPLALWATPMGYYDTSDACLDKVEGVLQALLCTDADIFYVNDKTVLRAIKDWIPLWLTNNFTNNEGVEVKHKEVWQKIAKKGETGDITIQFLNDEHPGMVKAKFICNLDTLIKDRSSKITPYTPNYWTNPILRDPLLAFSHTCFNSFTHKRGTYFLADVNDSIYDIGKRANYVGYSIVILNKPCSYMENLYYNIWKKITGDMIGWASMDRLFNKDITRDVQAHNNVIYQKSQYRLEQHFAGDDLMVIGEIKPIGLLRSGFDTYASLKRILKLCMDGGINEFDAVGLDRAIALNINHLLKDGKKLLKSLPVGTAHLKLPNPINHDKDMIVKLGKSMPNRNKLAALARAGANFWLIHWNESNTLIRYAIYIETPNGSAIYSNFYTDIIIKP